MRKLPLVLALTTCFCLPLALSPSARAAVLMALELRQLVEQSDYVVVAKAVDESSRYDDSLIVTDVTLEVVTSLKGAVKPGSSLTATHLGGAVGDIGLHVPGAATFTLGQSSVVFLRHAKGRAALNVTGMSQGVMPVVGTGSGATVETAGSGATLMKRDAQGALVEMPTQPVRTRVLADLLAEIDQLVHAK